MTTRRRRSYVEGMDGLYVTRDGPNAAGAHADTGFLHGALLSPFVLEQPALCVAGAGAVRRLHLLPGRRSLLSQLVSLGRPLRRARLRRSDELRRRCVARLHLLRDAPQHANLPPCWLDTLHPWWVCAGLPAAAAEPDHTFLAFGRLRPVRRTGRGSRPDLGVDPAAGLRHVELPAAGHRPPTVGADLARRRLAGHARGQSHRGMGRAGPYHRGLPGGHRASPRRHHRRDEAGRRRLVAPDARGALPLAGPSDHYPHDPQRHQRLARVYVSLRAHQGWSGPSIGSALAAYL